MRLIITILAGIFSMNGTEKSFKKLKMCSSTPSYLKKTIYEVEINDKQELVQPGTEFNKCELPSLVQF